MKKLLLLSALISLAFAPQAMAGKSSGCGLGSIAFEGQKGLLPNILASTTNGTSNSQTFGISSGTSNCDANDTVQLHKQREVFVADNHEMIFEDLSRGQGEYLAAFAQLMGCSAEATTHFAEVAQPKAGFIFGNNTNSAEVLNKTDQVIQGDARLKASCHAI